MLMYLLTSVFLWELNYLLGKICNILHTMFMTDYNARNSMPFLVQQILVRTGLHAVILDLGQKDGFMLS